ncbi:DNA-3-methyladenine glycosylase I [Marinomonas algicola]|uniref:DNA-3-methyladenine glycosylase I n=1 Tax=Marinomonas algicola TaxID=2773454 RepID=UPI00174EAEB6|nr:DNA-3-methyladenine glycosylase I [Marinomonas algicola]
MSVQRCGWCLGSPEYIAYHDNEWGKAVYDDRTLFEFIVLESAQAGLSWITILKKRAGYAKAFHNFDAVKVSQMTEGDIERLMQDTSIVRNKLKIKATITNAHAFLKIAEEFGSFSRYYWQYSQGHPIINSYQTLADVPAVTDLAEKISKDMKKRGFKFFGPTICYAYMQATGMMNDHLESCVAK